MTPAQQAAFTAHCAVVDARRRANPRDLDKILTPGVTGWDRALRLAEIVGGMSARSAIADTVKKWAITYDRHAHLPYIGLLLNWQPGITTGSFYAAMRPETIIVLLRGTILRAGRECRETGRYPYNRSLRMLIQRAYIAERLAVLRARVRVEQRQAVA